MNRLMKLLPPMMVVLILMVACKPNNQAKASSVQTQPQTASQTTSAQSAIWLDVRTPAEYQQGHLKTAINLPLDDVEQQIHTITSDKHATIYVYCRSGRRAKVARQTLMDLGYTNVINQGGYQDLLDKGVE